MSLVFAKFAELGSLTKVHAYFVANGIQLGLRVYKGPGKGRLVWRRPRRSALYEMLRHPFYAGAYAYGRCPFDPTRRVAGKPKSGRRNAPPEEWVCLLRDAVPAYIPWEQYEENRRRLAANDRGRGSKKATGRAPTLLNGIVRCGRCGKPMGAPERAGVGEPAVRLRLGVPGVRRAAVPERGGRVPGPADRVAGAQGGRAGVAGAEPPGRRASRAGPRSGCTRTGSSGWSGPSTRRTGRGGSTTRSTRRTGWWPGSWSGSGSRSWPSDERLVEDYARFQAEQPRHLSASDRERIAALAADLPGLWRGPTTTGGDRRAIVRLLIERVELTRARGVGAGRRGDPLARRGGHAARDPPGPADVPVARRAGTSSGSGSWSCGGTGGPRMRSPRCSTVRAIGRPAATGSPGDRVRQLLARFGQDGRPGRRARRERPAGAGRVVVAGAGGGTRGEADRGPPVAVVGMATRTAAARREWPVDRVGRRRRSRATPPAASVRDRAPRSADAPVRTDQPAESTGRPGPDNGLQSGGE